MRVGKKLFPYPVINNSEKVSSFKDSSFSLVYEDASDDEFLILKDAHLVIDDLNLVNLMSKGMVIGALVIECSATIYRVTKEISLENRDIIIPLSELNDKIASRRGRKKKTIPASAFRIVCSSDSRWQKR